MPSGAEFNHCQQSRLVLSRFRTRVQSTDHERVVRNCGSRCRHGGAFVNITGQVQECVRKSGVQEGLCSSTPCTSPPAVFINDDERGLHEDTRLAGKARAVEPAPALPPQPHRRGQRRRPPEAQIMGREVVVAITDGKLDFGPWEQIFYGEFDGRRRKRVLVKIIGE